MKITYLIIAIILTLNNISASYKTQIIKTIGQDNLPADMVEIIADYTIPDPLKFFIEHKSGRYSLFPVNQKEKLAKLVERKNISKWSWCDELKIYYNSDIQHATFISVQRPIWMTKAESNNWIVLSIVICYLLGVRKFTIGSSEIDPDTCRLDFYSKIDKYYIASPNLHAENIKPDRKLISQEELDNHFLTARNLLKKLDKMDQKVAVEYSNNLFYPIARASMKDLSLILKDNEDNSKKCVCADIQAKIEKFTLFFKNKL